MHCLPSRTGRELIDCLRHAAEAIGIEILTESVIETLFGDGGCIRGIEALRRNKIPERIGCDVLILACNGFGGNPDLVRRSIPEMSDALYFGHPGNRGDAIKWGESLGAMVSGLSAYQGHESIATPHNILISWAVIMQGGIQINSEGRRFCDETLGYSEQAAEMLRQPGGFVWNVFDERIAKVARQFEDFREAERAGAIRSVELIADLAAEMHVPTAAFVAEWAEVEKLKSADGQDRFGRKFPKAHGCKPPYHAVKVTGALFHTQGGLAVDSIGRVKRKDGTVFPNLFAARGAAAGVSGSTAGGYLSGNGLLTATTLGYLAGKAAAEQVLS
jgi:fumarate reductase flavoprotein subunit